MKDDLSHYLRLAETEEIVITRHGKPAGVLIGFESEDDWFEYRLENDSRFQRRIETARHSLQAGRCVRPGHRELIEIGLRIRLARTGRRKAIEQGDLAN